MGQAEARWNWDAAPAYVCITYKQTNPQKKGNQSQLAYREVQPLANDKTSDITEERMR